jgi:type I restriction enzyme S subunit
MDRSVGPGTKIHDAPPVHEGWEVRPLLSTVRIANGQVDPKIHPYKSMILVAPDHIERATGRLLAKETAEDQRAISGKYAFQRGDIVYSKIRPYLRKAILAEFDGLCSADMYPLKPASDVAGGFVLAILLDDRFSKYAESVSVRSGMPKLNRVELADFAFALPPLQEQRAITEALSDVDALLGALDRLIAKKRDLKQAAMQQLLTGQTRLPGFSAPWAARTVLGVTVKIVDYRGRTPRKLGMDWGGGDIPVLSAGNVKMGYIDFSEEAYLGSDELYERWMTNGRARKGDVVITTEAPLGNVALVPDERRYILSQRTVLLQIDPQVATSKYLLYALSGSAFQKLLVDSASGSTATGIQRKRLEKLELHLPPVAEQDAIAAVLASSDAELSALEQRRDKTHALKQGMMQELLTGRIRLI